MAKTLVKEAQKHIGVVKGTTRHKAIVDDYNRRRPLPMGYRVTYWDDWCDIFVTFVSDQVGATAYIGRECGVQRHVQIFKRLEIWIGRQYPKLGDIIIFDWDQNGWADHIGIVSDVIGNKVMTIEGNSNNRVAQNRFVWNDRRIMGYARPKYPGEALTSTLKSTTPPSSPENLQERQSSKECQCFLSDKDMSRQSREIEVVALEILRGKWGSGLERIRLLRQSGYDPEVVQNRVNVLMKK